MGLRANNEKDNAKMKSIAGLKSCLENLNIVTSSDRAVHVCMFTNTEGRMNFYRSSWPTVSFLSLDETIRECAHGTF